MSESNYSNTEKPDTQLIYKATQIITDFGIRANTKGYHYLRDAIIRAASCSEEHFLITKQLYPETAKKFKTNPCCVERAIRHCIETAWYRLLCEKAGETPFFRNKPTNAEFIATAADKIRIDLNLP